MVKTFFIAALALSALSLPAAAISTPGANLVTNGSFETSTYTSNSEFGGQFGEGVTGWTRGGTTSSHSQGPLDFYYFGGTQDTVNATNRFNDPGAYFHAGTFTALSPDGGNFVALDGDSQYRGQLSQTINGLIAGKTYKLSFDWAASQLVNRTGPTTEQLQVGFGGDTVLTNVISNPSGGFTPTGWETWSYTFTATGTSELLSFLSIGTPNGLPPIAVLDGVSLTQTPEPAALALLGLGVLGLGAARLRRR